MQLSGVGEPTLCVTCGLPSLFGGAAHDAASAVLDTLTSALDSAAAWMVSHVVALATTTTQAGFAVPARFGVPGTGVHLGQHWFELRYGLMLQTAMLVVVPLLLAATIGAVLRQDFRRLGRVWGVGLPVAVLSGFAGIQLASLALAATDGLCSAVLSGVGGKVHGDFAVLATAMVIPGAPQLVAAFISVLLIVGAVLLWLELVLRAASIYIAVFFMPMAMAAYVWPATAGIAKRAIEMLVALILSKFVIVATLTLGVNALSPGPSADNAMVGSAILLLAAFAPFSLLRLAPIVETAAIAHLEGVARRPVRAASAAAAAPAHPAAQILATRLDAAHRPPDATSVTAHRLAERQPDYSSAGTGRGQPAEGNAGAAGGNAGPAAGNGGAAAGTRPYPPESAPAVSGVGVGTASPPGTGSDD